MPEIIEEKSESEIISEGITQIAASLSEFLRQLILEKTPDIQKEIEEKIRRIRQLQKNKMVDEEMIRSSIKVLYERYLALFEIFKINAKNNKDQKPLTLMEFMSMRDVPDKRVAMQNLLEILEKGYLPGTIVRFAHFIFNYDTNTYFKIFPGVTKICHLVASNSNNGNKLVLDPLKIIKLSEEEEAEAKMKFFN
jgi:hypothetical protein